MIRRQVLLNRHPENLREILLSTLAGTGIALKPGTLEAGENGFVVETMPSLASWWGEMLYVLAEPYGGGALVRLASDHNGPSAFKDLDNADRLLQSIRRTSRTLGIECVSGLPLALKGL
jgi:hypothetical protein